MSECSPVELIAAHQKRIEEMNREEDEPRNALDYLQDVYRGRRVADPWRFRAAVAALQFETPRLGVIATTSLNGADFAALLDKAIARANGVREVKQIRRALPKPE
jgi:hypothetical protein